MLTTAITSAITSTQLLIGYGVLCAVVAIGIRWQWQRAIGQKEHTKDPLPELGLYQLAMLGGGPQLAITSAVAQLHRDGLITVDASDGGLKAAGALDPTADPLAREVLATIRRQPAITAPALRADVAQSEAVRSMTARLTEVGLLLDEQQASRLRRLWLVGGLLAAVGIAAILSPASDDPTLGWLLAMVLVVVFATFRLFRHRPLATNRGRALLTRTRAERDDLRRHPGMGESAMTTALFGGAALWVADPAIASALGVPREGDSGAGWRGGGGGSCSAGGGCSSGSSGAGCGGGGGGCGGGGGGG